MPKISGAKKRKSKSSGKKSASKKIRRAAKSGRRARVAAVLPKQDDLAKLLSKAINSLHHVDRNTNGS